MPVSDPLAFQLLRAFGRLENQLKLRPQFLGADRHGNAQANWLVVQDAVAALDPADFVEQVSAGTRRKILTGERDRPKVQKVVNEDGRRTARFRERNLDPAGRPPSDARALVEAAKRVRNNLFHGGKEDPGEQPFDGDDEQWAEAALDVICVLQQLVDNGTFGPPDL